MSKILFCCSALLVCTHVLCQLDSILNIKDRELRLATFINYFEDNVASEKYDSILNDASSKVSALSDDKLMREIWILKQEFKSRTFRGPTLLSTTIPLIKAIEEARKKSMIYEQAKLCANIGNFYHAQGRVQKGFEYLIRALDLIKQLRVLYHPEVVKISDIIAANYYLIGDHSTALNLYKIGMEVEPYWRNPKERFVIYNNIGLCFQKQMQLDSAIHFYTLANESAWAVNNDFWVALTDGNRAYCHYLKGNFEDALPPLLKDFELSERWGEIGSAVNAAITIASIYLAKNNINQAKHYLDYGRKNIKSLSHRQKINYYKSLMQIHRDNGDYKQALFYLDSMQMYKDTVASYQDNNIIRNAELKLGLEKHRHEVDLLESEKSRQILIRNFLLLILSLVGIIIGLWFYGLHINKKRALKLSEIEKAQAYRELEQAKKDLNNFTQLIREKNELINSIKTELSELESNKSAERRIENINTLLNSIILTDDDWREFKKIFDKIHPGFFIRLSEKFPNLSSGEIRLMALLKLNLSQKDMAYMLGIGYDAIRQSKYRLKNKISFSGETTLEDLVLSI